MNTVTFEEIEIDRCEGCAGIWFDASEHEQLLALKGSGAIDSGDPQVGKEMNLVDRIRCPRCTGAMLRMVDREQTHVWYEQCYSCSGIYLDAGEFRDLKTDSWLDFFRDLRTPERR